MAERAPGASEWAGRIAFIIDTYEGGNISAAARRAGVTQQALSRLIREAGIPRGDTLAALARAYPRVSAEWLLTGRGPREREMPTGTAAVREVLDALGATLAELRARWGV